MKQSAASSNRRSIFSWCLYDWGNSAFSTVIITFIFSVYFARAVVGDETQASVLWSYALSCSGFLVALLAPFCGALADRYGARKRWLFLCGLLCCFFTALLWFSAPQSSEAMIFLTLFIIVFANVFFELSLIFANAILPHIAPKAMLGRISGWSWGLGYAGGLVCLVVALLGFVGLGEMQGVLRIPVENSENVRATALLTAFWMFLFMLPLFFFTHDNHRTSLNFLQSIKEGLRSLFRTIAEIKKHHNLARFLIASMLYRDGLNTLFAIGGLYAAGTFAMAFEEILIFAVGLNVTAGLGAACFAFMDDKLGSKKTIIVALCGLIATGLVLVLVQEKSLFLIFALLLGLFLGPAQAASRTMASRLTPPEMSGQTYGLYALTGKSTAFLGPLIFGFATSIFDSQRIGVASIILFWVAGLIILRKVREI